MRHAYGKRTIRIRTPNEAIFYPDHYGGEPPVSYGMIPQLQKLGLPTSIVPPLHHQAPAKLYAGIYVPRRIFLPAAALFCESMVNCYFLAVLYGVFCLSSTFQWTLIWRILLTPLHTVRLGQNASCEAVFRLHRVFHPATGSNSQSGYSVGF